MTRRAYWNEEVETLDRQSLQRLQLTKLNRQLRAVESRSHFYQSLWRQAGTSVSELRSLEELHQFPFTTKEMLRQAQADAPPLGTHAAVDPAAVAIICASSGTTGRPVFMPLTRHDQDAWNEVLCRIYWSWGVRPGDRFAHLASFHMFTAGLPVYPATLRLGVTMLPIGAQVSSERALALMAELRPTVMSITPSFGEHLTGQVNDVLGMEPWELGVKHIGCGAEPLLQGTRDRLNDAWRTQVFNMGGMGEICTGLWTECRRHEGLHFMANDYALVELVDPDSDEPVDVADGATGELVYTALDREAGPLVRYRSGDQATILSLDRCACGRTSMRFTLAGRTDDMLKVRGVRVWASAIRDVVASDPRTTGHAQVVVPERGVTQPSPLSVEVEARADLPPDAMLQFGRELETLISDRLLVRTAIRLVPEGSLGRTSGKYRYIRYMSES